MNFKLYLAKTIEIFFFNFDFIKVTYAVGEGANLVIDEIGTHGYQQITP